jgi:hypothetical protein
MRDVSDPGPGAMRLDESGWDRSRPDCFTDEVQGRRVLLVDDLWGNW